MAEIKEITIKLSKSDYLNFQIFAWSQSPLTKKQYKVARIIFPIFVMIMGVIVAYVEKTNWQIGIVLYATVSLLWYVFFPYFMRRSRKRYLTKYVDEHYSDAVDKETRINFGDDFVDMHSSLGASQLNYSAIASLYKLKNYYYLKLSSSTNLIIPKQYVDNEAEFERFICEKTTKSWQDFQEWSN